MAIIGDALRQAFMPKHEYESLREEEKAWGKIQRPLVISVVAVIIIAIFLCTVISLRILFPGSSGKRPFCVDRKLQTWQIGTTKSDSDSDLLPSAFYLTDQEIADYYWMVVFIPSFIIFAVSSLYLVAGIAVAFSAPTRHGCLKVVENNYCASRRGGVRCLSILNIIFAILFGLLALFFGSSLLTLVSNCSSPLFWCFEISSWGLVILYSGTAFFLRRRAAVILDEGNFSSRNLGLEMLEANPLEITSDVERRVNEGFKAWMGSSLLSSDDEDEPDNYEEASHLTGTNSNRQRLGSC
ncbi:hypothetical protein HN51_032520 [Arachis hypogaea]|uniref:Transmembrane protein n=1 Tax=Arachis hypogaea TaxID=3818 RepID=A0A445B4C3_ARAHY|nr:uncharacterized protein LOC112716155 [Arachis hypogaea]QHO16846.1 uncharacterized protein DS421_10g307110 [Arachis hypogaea]RYR33530.1 hypothetical protein Ahy_A10g048142 [Arachis hypogaea]